MDLSSFYQGATFVLAVVAIVLSAIRFKREITVIGPKIEFLTRERYGVDADHSSLRERKRWHYQFDLTFQNQGDRHGLLIIDSIETDLFETVAQMKDNMRYERQYPIVIPIKDGDIAKIRFGGNVYRFEETKKDETLRVSFRTWMKHKTRFWQRSKTREVIDCQPQEISLLLPKRTRHGTDERIQKSKERVANDENNSDI